MVMFATKSPKLLPYYPNTLTTDAFKKEESIVSFEKKGKRRGLTTVSLSHRYIRHPNSATNNKLSFRTKIYEYEQQQQKPTMAKIVRPRIASLTPKIMPNACRIPTTSLATKKIHVIATMNPAKQNAP